MFTYPEEFCKSRGEDGGYFIIPYYGRNLFCVASHGLNWEHVSVSLKNRCPNWPEMCFVKEIFWGPNEWVMQLHPPKTENINLMPYCLHLWRPMHESIPVPSSIMV